MHTAEAITFPSPSSSWGEVKAVVIFEADTAEARAAARAAKRLARSRRINAEKHDRRVMLKIKLKDLAAEARSIRREELLRHGGWLRHELWVHRTRDVRGEARATHLAYGFLRGRPLSRMEPKRTESGWDRLLRHHHEKPLRERVRSLVKKYGPRDAVVPDAWFEETGA